MKEILTKEIADELMKIKGEGRGIAPKSHVQFFVEEKGEEVFKKVEDRMAELGQSVKYKNIKSMNFYPIGLEALTLLVVKELFNLSDEKLRKIGEYQSKVSLIIKLFMKYFISVEGMVQKAPIMWRKYYTVGDLKVIEFSEEEKYVILQLQDFKIHSPYCRILEGYFASVVKMIVNEDVDCKEVKCPFKGDNYHEFLIKW
jgi:predicted hydrocarbon binding protein